MKRRTWLHMLMLTALVAGIVMSWDGHGNTVQAEKPQKQNTQKQNTQKQSVTNSQSQAADVIPEDAIRLRILAHSDKEEDQQVKNKVRDAVVEAMNGWLEKGDTPRSREEARNWIESHLDEIQVIAANVVQQEGYSHAVKAELKVVPFPAKLYGGQAYPAGNYEALRITIGSGEGQNWWCVLFPPLCFVDGTQGTAVAAADMNESGASSGTAEGEKGKSDNKNGQVNGADGSKQAEPADREVRFFLWDVLSAIFGWIGELFSALF